jgi:hypothetical protein
MPVFSSSYLLNLTLELWRVLFPLLVKLTLL